MHAIDVDASWRQALRASWVMVAGILAQRPNDDGYVVVPGAFGHQVAGVQVGPPTNRLDSVRMPSRA